MGTRKPPGKPPIPDDKRERIVTRLKQGHHPMDIAEDENVGLSFVYEMRRAIKLMEGEK